MDFLKKKKKIFFFFFLEILQINLIGSVGNRKQTIFFFRPNYIMLCYLTAKRPEKLDRKYMIKDKRGRGGGIFTTKRRERQHNVKNISGLVKHLPD